MPESKTDKKRKQKLVNYKNKVKKQMSDQNQNQQIPEIRSYPIWNSQETIEVSGLEWEAIYNYINIARQAVVAGESVMQRNTQSGKITMKFMDSEGKEVSNEEVQEYTKKIQEMFQQKAKEQAEKKGSILTPEGEPIQTAEVSETQETPKDPNPLRAV